MLPVVSEASWDVPTRREETGVVEQGAVVDQLAIDTEGSGEALAEARARLAEVTQLLEVAREENRALLRYYERAVAVSHDLVREARAEADELRRAAADDAEELRRAARDDASRVRDEAKVEAREWVLVSRADARHMIAPTPGPREPNHDDTADTADADPRRALEAALAEVERAVAALAGRVRCTPLAAEEATVPTAPVRPDDAKLDQKFDDFLEQSEPEPSRAWILGE